MAQVDKSGVNDGISVELNGDKVQGAKGPDPAQWPVEDREVSKRKVDQQDATPAEERTVVFDPDKGPETVMVAPPHPDEWGDEAREERGAN